MHPPAVEEAQKNLEAVSGIEAAVTEMIEAVPGTVEEENWLRT